MRDDPYTNGLGLAHPGDDPTTIDCMFIGSAERSSNQVTWAASADLSCGLGEPGKISPRD